MTGYVGQANKMHNLEYNIKHICKQDFPWISNSASWTVLCLNSAYSARLAAAKFNGSGLSIHSAHPGKTTMDQRICKAFSGYKRLWSDTGLLSKPNSLNQALEFNCRGQGNDAKCISFLSATSAIYQIVYKIRKCFRPLLDGGWNETFWFTRTGTLQAAVTCWLSLMLWRKLGHSVLVMHCILSHPHYFQLRHRHHSLKSHHSPLHPVCQQTSQRTDNSLPASECLLLLLFRLLLLLLLLPRRAYQRLQCRRTERKMGPPIRTQPCVSCHKASFVHIRKKNFLGRLVLCRWPSRSSQKEWNMLKSRACLKIVFSENSQQSNVKYPDGEKENMKDLFEVIKLQEEEPHRLSKALKYNSIIWCFQFMKLSTYLTCSCVWVCGRSWKHEGHNNQLFLETAATLQGTGRDGCRSRCCSGPHSTSGRSPRRPRTCWGIELQWDWLRCGTS